MNYEQILYNVTNRVATISLNRPDKLNAWTARMEDEFVAAMRGAAGDEGVRAIVVTGAGRGFCAGADMSLLSAAADKGQRTGAPTADFAFDASAPADLQKKYSWILSVPKPTIAAINGHAVGLGFVIPLYCDIRLASDAAKFCTIFGKRGLVAEYGMAWMLPRIVGLANATDLLFTARVMDAQEALRIGLVQRVIADADFRGVVQTFAEDIANNISPRSLRIMKKQLYDALSQPLGAAIDVAYAEMVASFGTEDFREGVQHFLEKRAAAFTGR